MPFKVKIYLPQTREGVLGEGVPFMDIHTNWTFAQATQRQSLCRLNNKEEETGFYRYVDCLYIDGSNWSLYEIDGCVAESDAPLLSSYEVFSRVYRRVPIYSEPEMVANELSPEVVAEHFPLAVIYGGAMLGGIEFVLTKRGYLQRKFHSDIETVRDH